MVIIFVGAILVISIIRKGMYLYQYNFLRKEKYLFDWSISIIEDIVSLMFVVGVFLYSI